MRDWVFLSTAGKRVVYQTIATSLRVDLKIKSDFRELKLHKQSASHIAQFPSNDGLTFPFVCNT